MIEENKRVELFHIRIISKHTKIDTLFDSWSLENLIYEEQVRKFVLETKNHPKPFPLGWLKENTQMKVTKQCWLRFAITTNFVDKVELDVIPLDICWVVLGSLSICFHIYDLDAIFHRKKNEHHLFKYGIEYVVRAHRIKTNLDIINVSQMKTLINSSKKYICVVVKEQPKDKYDDFQGVYSHFKDKLVEIVDYYKEMFKELKRLPPTTWDSITK